ESLLCLHEHPVVFDWLAGIRNSSGSNHHIVRTGSSIAQNLDFPISYPTDLEPGVVLPGSRKRIELLGALNRIRLAVKTKASRDLAASGRGHFGQVEFHQATIVVEP